MRCRTNQMRCRGRKQLILRFEFQNDIINTYGVPHTLYDWVCLQHARSASRRHVSTAIAPMGSTLHLASAAGSTLDIATLSSSSYSARLLRPMLSGTTFYLSTSSPSNSDTCENAPAVPSLEATLVELVEECEAKLRDIQEEAEGALNEPSAPPLPLASFHS